MKGLIENQAFNPIQVYFNYSRKIVYHSTQSPRLGWLVTYISPLRDLIVSDFIYCTRMFWQADKVFISWKFINVSTNLL
jgi:hypothetical protein